MYAYAVCSAIGLIAGGWIAHKLPIARPAQVVRLPLYVCVIWGGILGAKIPVWLSYGVRGYLIQGKSVLGGLLGAFVAVHLYKMISGRKGGLGGRFVIPLAVAIGFGKIGCFLNGCCGGTLAFPVQLLESIFQFVVALGLYLFYKRTQRSDLLFPLYLLSYLLMRFVIEFWRVEPRIIAGMTVYQGLAILFIPICIFIIWRRVHDGMVTAG